MSHFRHLVLALATTATLTGSALGAQERFTLTGREVTIYNLAGSLRVVQGSGSGTEVEVSRIGRDAARLRIEPGTSGEASTLRVVYPSDEIIYPGMRGSSQTTLTVAEDGTFGRGTRDGREVRIYSRDRGPAGTMEAGADIMVRVPAGARLRAHVAVGDVEARSVNATLNLNTSSGHITAAALRGDIALASASGSVSAEDLEGKVTLASASGSVDLENVRADEVTVNVASGAIDVDRIRAPRIQLRTASGRIRATEVETDRLSLNSASGSVTANGVATGDLQVSTASGSITVDLTRPVRSAELRAISGSVNLRVPENMGATLELRTVSGGINVSVPMTITTQRRGYTAGTIGDGSARIFATTTSGSVSVRTR